MRLAVFFLVAMVFGTTVALAPVQQPRKTNPDADRINYKIQRLLIMDQLLPVLLTKEQVKALLPVIEKARQDEIDVEKKELEQLKAIEPELDKELDAAIKERKTPTDEFTIKFNKMVGEFTVKRRLLVDLSSFAVLKKMKEVCNDGQLKAAEKALDPKAMGEKDPESFTSDQKIILWIRNVLLDRASYDVLVDMSR